LRQEILFKAIIFDLEGVLVYHKKRQAALFEESFKNNGIKLNFKVEPVYSIRSNPKYHSGRDFIKKLFSLNKTTYNSDLAEKIFFEYKEKRKNPVYLNNLQKLIPGTKEVLNKIKRKKIKLAIVSNANPKQVNFLLKNFGLKKYFDLVVDDSSRLKEKPSPERINFVIKKFNVNPEEVLMIEDSVSGIIAAKEAKISAIGVLTGSARKKDFQKAKTDLVVTSVKSLLKEFS
jgi:beta-phosphoglucomutase